ncbi:hypothetical protein DPMN_084385 [Dreissena polymorpha]|uniref:Uncharacterized protein n=1 Tax=Dreissena polymorpha TaxID=45954 RepID=A0A9D3YEG2_DREPO|nr:hypothetical protein DPMN_084385 [Dreissena polymorpha]
MHEYIQIKNHGQYDIYSEHGYHNGADDRPGVSWGAATSNLMQAEHTSCLLKRDSHDQPRGEVDAALAHVDVCFTHFQSSQRT